MYKVIVTVRAKAQIDRGLLFWESINKDYTNRIAIEIDEILNYVLVHHPYIGSNSDKKPGYKILYPGDGNFKLVYKIIEKDKLVKVTHFFSSRQKISNYI